MATFDPTRVEKSVTYNGRDAIIISMTGGKVTLTYARKGETPVFAVDYDDDNLVVEYE